MNLNEEVIFNHVKPPVRIHTEFPSVIDNTAREAWTNCPTKFQRQVVQKLSKINKSPDLHFGAAFALGLETFRRAAFSGESSDEAALVKAIRAATEFYGEYEPPTGHAKTYDRLVEALIAYAHKYPTAYDHIKPFVFPSGDLALEFTFAIPLPILHPETGDPLLYAGRFDMLATFNNQVFVFDDKTTSRLGPTWSSQWRTSSQITGYCWAARSFGVPVAGAIIRGQSILKNEFGFAEVIEYRSSERILQWYDQLLGEIEDMITAWKQSRYRKAFNAACSNYGGCPFIETCLSNNPEVVIEMNFVNHYWNPLDKEPLQETPGEAK